MNKTFFALLLLIICMTSVSALGVTPARTTIGFNPGQEQTVKFTVVNSEYQDLNLLVYVRGDLNQSIRLSETEFTMSRDVESKELSYTFTLPEELSPGQHGAEIVVLQKPEGASVSEAFVGATVAVVTQLVVNVPYPGKYIVGSLNVINAQQNAETKLIVSLASMGREDVSATSAEFTIYDSSNNEVGKFNVNGIGVKSGQRGEIVGSWIARVPLGNYIAKAKITYDGSEINLQKEFVVGDETLELQQVNVPRFTLGGIAKFEMLIENKWSEPISGAYAQTQVFKENGDILADFKSPTYDIPPLNKSTFVSYWDTVGVEEGIYNTSVYMRYGSKYSLQNIQLKVTNNEIIALGLGFVISENTGGSSLVKILLIVIGILILMNIAWFLVLRKRLKK